ncbi:hypothetical protein HUJ05_002942 [Dendroctonus ponderosae]|nr:hypothetical protein HUJ05_002942 [Dendroctonus ponderosae]
MGPIADIDHTLTVPPEFVEPIPNVTVALGRDASLPCVVKNLGTYKVAWIHIDRQMILTIHRHVISRIPRFSVSYDNDRTWLLHVSNAHREDRGYYMCQVNTNPMISQVGYLQVVVPPNIIDSLSTPSNVAIRENQNVSLTCKAEGFPTPSVKWRRGDSQEIIVDRKNKVASFDGEHLNLTRISRSEMGVYLCIATNGVPPSVSKRVVVDVEFPPMIWVPNQLVGAPAGTDVTLDCHTEAHPKAISYWVRDNVMLLPTKKYGAALTESSYMAHMKLTVRNLQTIDFGNYRCISKNSLGETEGSIRLYEIPMPTTISKPTEARSHTHRENLAKRNVSKQAQEERMKSKMITSTENDDNTSQKKTEARQEYGVGFRTPSSPQLSGCVSMVRWTFPQFAAVILNCFFCQRHV